MIASGLLFTFIFKFIVFTFVLGILVTVHEAGHFLFAKFFNVGVYEFAVGFGRKLWSYRRGETEYSIRAIPLGGFVRMVGDDPREFVNGKDEDPEPEPEEHDSEYDRLQARMRADRSRWFLSQGFWPKFLIVFAGPLFNFILAFFLVWINFTVFGIGESLDRPVIGGVTPGYPAEAAGLQPDDEVLAVGSFKPTSWHDMAEAITSQAEQGVDVLVKRGDQQLSFSLKGKLDDKESAEILGSERRFRIGIVPKVEIRSAGSWEAIYYSGIEVGMWSYLTLRGIVKMVSGIVSPRNIRGPIYIFGEAGEVAKRGVAPLLKFMMILSVSLAVLNLLPVPVLDGGHLMIFTIEAVIGEPLSLEAQERASQIGIFILLCLMVFAVGNDIVSMVEG